MILYLGNFIQRKGVNPTLSLELAKNLAKQFSVRVAGRSHQKALRLWQMIWALLSTKPKVILIDAYATQAFWYLILLTWLARRRGIPYIPILHSGAWPVRWKRYPRLSKQALLGSQRIVCTSLYLYREFPWDQQGLEVIHNFSDVPPSFSQLRETYNGKILWVREYQPRYGDEEVLALGRWMLEKGLSSTITMIGPKRDSITQRVAKQMKSWPENVEARREMTHKEWYDFSRDYTLFLNTSQVDSFPVSLIEALALGLPVLSTQVGGIQEMIRHQYNGWLTPISSVKDMGAIIQFLESHPEKLLAISEQALRQGRGMGWRSVKPLWEELLMEFL